MAASSIPDSRRLLGVAAAQLVRDLLEDWAVVAAPSAVYAGTSQNPVGG
jgi:hypothetical protein